MTFKKGHKYYSREEKDWCLTCGEDIEKGKEIKGETGVFCSEKCREICED